MLSPTLFHVLVPFLSSVILESVRGRRLRNGETWRFSADAAALIHLINVACRVPPLDEGEIDVIIASIDRAGSHACRPVVPAPLGLERK